MSTSTNITASTPALTRVWEDDDKEAVCATFEIGSITIDSWAYTDRSSRVSVKMDDVVTSVTYVAHVQPFISIDLIDEGDTRDEATGYLTIEEARRLRDALDEAISEHDA